ncbi:MAG: hypothetical protein ACUVRD_09345 [Bacteroidia bacterium]
MKRPFSYGEQVEELYEMTYTARGFEVEAKGRATLEADGQGTLLLPTGEYKDVLSIKLTQIEKHTMKAYNSSYEMRHVTYLWFDR